MGESEVGVLHLELLAEHLGILELSLFLVDVLELEPLHALLQPVVPLEEGQVVLVRHLLVETAVVQLHHLHVLFVVDLERKQAHPEEFFLLVSGQVLHPQLQLLHHRPFLLLVQSSEQALAVLAVLVARLDVRALSEAGSLQISVSRYQGGPGLLTRFRNRQFLGRELNLFSGRLRFLELFFAQDRDILINRKLGLSNFVLLLGLRINRLLKDHVFFLGFLLR